MYGMILKEKDIQPAVVRISAFLQQCCERAGRKNIVIGLSGGIDSSLSAKLAVNSLGAEAVFGILMPYKTSSKESLADAPLLANQLKIETTTIEISPMVDAYFAGGDADQVQRGNKMARERMSILFDYAHRRQALVLGTGNRTEIALGYTTVFGDSACSLNPIGELYKTEVRAVARYLGIPAPIIEKAPSADLWSGQTDEGDIGVTYELIDQILFALLDDNIRLKKALEQHFPASAVARVVELVNRHYFKRQSVPVASMGKSTIPDHIELRP